VPTDPRSESGRGSSLGPYHEEGEVVRKAVAGGRGEEEQGRRGGDSPRRKTVRRGGERVSLGRPFIDARSRGQSGGRESLAHERGREHRGGRPLARSHCRRGTRGWLSAGGRLGG
jgi:hypothetical protein